MSYHEDCLFAAVSALATHGRVKQRLILAYGDHLDGIDEDDLPLALRETFSELRQKMYSVTPANGEGSICASVRKMSKPQADQCASMILELYRDVVRMGDSLQSQMPLSAEESSVIPPFLVKSG
jgi:hypothetical protein